MAANKGKILYQTVIYGQPITKKNSNQIIQGRNGKPVIIPSSQYCAYEADALEQIKPPPEPIDCPCNIQVEYHVRDLIRRDLVNLLAGTCDILVRAGVLSDDNWRIAYSHDGSHVIVDRHNPRAVVIITARDDIDQTRWKKAKETQPRLAPLNAPPPAAAE